MHWRKSAASVALTLAVNGSVSSVAQQNTFNVFCDTLDPGTASCKILPRGPRIECFSASGGIPQCIEPESKVIVNCVPYQLQTGGNWILQMNCSHLAADLNDPISDGVINSNIFNDSLEQEQPDSLRNTLE